MSKIVIALGGNALGKTLEEQMKAVKKAVIPIVDMVEDGHEVVLTSGNGPQVGMISLAMDGLSRSDGQYCRTPLSVCVAMSQAYIGYDLQNCLREELLNRGIKKDVCTIVTQVCVDAQDPAFVLPSKPIGNYLTPQDVEYELSVGHRVMEDAGRGVRRVVASPEPVSIVEIGAVRALVAAGQLVIAGVGGGIPVVERGNGLKGAGAVIDKDLMSSLLARLLDADLLVVLTAIEKVAINFGKPDQRWLDEISVEKAREYMAQGHFAPGSMLPKVRAAVEFAQSKPGRRALITLLDKAKDGIEGRTGTVVYGG